MKTWIKSTYSGGDGDNCLEWAAASDLVAVRDSKDPDGPSLHFSAAAWSAFIDAVSSDALPTQ